MGKKKEKSSTEQTTLSMIDADLSQTSNMQSEMPPVAKKPKKHKRKKSSKKEKHSDKDTGPSKSTEMKVVESSAVLEEDQEISVDVEMDHEDSLSDSTSGMKLIIKTPDTATEKSALKTLQKSKSDKSKTSSGSKKSGKKKDGSKGDDDTDSEEERWLHAIESGKLEEVDDELKRIKNPRLMTARQRALMEKRSDGVEEGFVAIPAEPLLALPTGFKEKVLTEEMLAKKAIKSKRRREQAIEKREEDKKKTVDRLLKKQDSKISRGARSKGLKKTVPLTTYVNNCEGVFFSFPVGMETPITPLVERNPPKPVVCAVSGCFNLKKYSCSKTGVPICSLNCYKRNLEKEACTT